MTRTAVYRLGAADPTCTGCGRPHSDPDEFGQYFCDDCGQYRAPMPGTPAHTELEDLPRIGAEMRADWSRSQFRLVHGATNGP
jgi:hypothetical protein